MDFQWPVDHDVKRLRLARVLLHAQIGCIASTRVASPRVMWGHHYLTLANQRAPLGQAFVHSSVACLIVVPFLTQLHAYTWHHISFNSSHSTMRILLMRPANCHLTCGDSIEVCPTESFSLKKKKKEFSGLIMGGEMDETKNKIKFQDKRNEDENRIG